MPLRFSCLRPLSLSWQECDVERGIWIPVVSAVALMFLGRLRRPTLVATAPIALLALIAALDAIGTARGQAMVREELHPNRWASEPEFNPLVLSGNEPAGDPALLAGPARLRALDGSESLDAPYEPAQRTRLASLLKRVAHARPEGSYPDGLHHLPSTQVVIGVDSRLRAGDLRALAEATSQAGVDAMIWVFEDPFTFPRTEPNRSPASWVPWVFAERTATRILVRVAQSPSRPFTVVGASPSGMIETETEMRWFPQTLDAAQPNYLETLRPLVDGQPSEWNPVRLELTDDATAASVALAAVDLSRMELVATLAAVKARIGSDD